MTIATQQVSASDAATQALARVVATLAEDAIFAVAAAGSELRDALDGLAKRRADAYAAVLQGKPLYRMRDQFDYWIVEMSRAMAPIAPPLWLPMSDVVREKVTLEIGARGLRALFSSKPSDKDVQRVKRLGTLAVRVLRAVLAADGAIDGEEQRTIAALVGSFGLSQEDAAPLYAEGPIDPAQLDVYGEIEANVARAIVRGAWLAAAWDTIDPREEQVVRTVAKKLAQPDAEVEAARADALARVDARRQVGLATVDAIRFVLSDRAPGSAVEIAEKAGALVLPRRYRDEALAQVRHGGPVTLAKRYGGLNADERHTVLAIAWAAALHDDPSLARRALLRARHERVAADIGDDGVRARVMVDEWLAEALAPLAPTVL